MYVYNEIMMSKYCRNPKQSLGLLRPHKGEAEDRLKIQAICIIMADGELKAYRELIYQNTELQPEKNIIARLYGAKINRHKSQCLYSQ